MSPPILPNSLIKIFRMLAVISNHRHQETINFGTFRRNQVGATKRSTLGALTTFSSMSPSGQSRRFDARPATSRFLPSTDINRPARLVRFVPHADSCTALDAADTSQLCHGLSAEEYFEPDYFLLITFQSPTKTKLVASPANANVANMLPFIDTRG